jgi:Flp pilus assembly protein TadG
MRILKKEGQPFMKKFKKIPVLGRFVREDMGQTLVFTAMILTGFLGVTGVAVDAGKGYYAFQMLRASTNAAALAGAAGMPNTTTATTYADNYGSKTAAFNTNGVMNSVTTSVSFECLTSVTTDFDANCENSTGGSTGTTYNAVQVQQTAKVPTWIGPLFGMPTFNIQDTATASMKGGTPTPYNIAIILDTTESMTGADNGSNNTSNCSSQLACAELGIQTLLQGLVPGTSSSPVDQVTLFVFPGASNSSIANDYNCSGNNPSIVPYGFTSATSLSSTTSEPSNYALPSGSTYNALTTYNGSTSSYQLNWSTDYSTGPGTTLSTASNLVKAVGGKSGCSGIQAPGGEGTYYASVIYSAGAALSAQHTANGNKNMLIILTDGDATACNSQSYPSNNCGSGVGSGGKEQIDVSTCPKITTANGAITSAAPCAGTYSGQPINGTFCSKSSNTTEPNCTSAEIDPSGESSPTFPSAIGECGQAVVAAQWVSSLPDTEVYTVAYGSENSGCTTDSTYSASVSTSTSGYGSNNWAAGDSPCAAIGAMATDSNHFFSDNYSKNCPGGSNSNSNNALYTSLKSQFGKILSNITSARLIPNNAT